MSKVKGCFYKGRYIFKSQRNLLSGIKISGLFTKKKPEKSGLKKYFKKISFQEQLLMHK